MRIFIHTYISYPYRFERINEHLLKNDYFFLNCELIGNL